MLVPKATTAVSLHRYVLILQVSMYELNSQHRFIGLLQIQTQSCTVFSYTHLYRPIRRAPLQTPADVTYITSSPFLLTTPLCLNGTTLDSSSCNKTASVCVSSLHLS